MILVDYFFIAFFAFVLGIVDSSLGMGYGTLLSPMLIVMGFDPLKIVPAVLFSQLAGDFLAALFHHKLRNVNLSVGSKHLKIALILSILGLTGAVIAVLIAVNLPSLYLNLYIGLAVAVSGIIILAAKHKRYSFSWIRLFCLGSFAAFNKGMSGGGYGPIVVTGQILSGVEVKSAIAITSLSEGVTCIFAVVTYFLVSTNVDWPMLILLSVGIAFSAPIAALVVRKIESSRMMSMIGIFTILLGLLTILKALQP